MIEAFIVFLATWQKKPTLILIHW